MIKKIDGAALPVRILGLGCSLPERCIANDELEREYGLERGWIERATGVRERRRAVGETTLSLAARAATLALADARTSVDELDLIIGAATAPHQSVPCTAALLQRALGAPDGRSACFDVNSTCLSFLTALDLASRLIAGGRHRRVLIVSSEITHHSLDPREPESAALLGDGAGAAVLGPSEDERSRFLAARFETHSSGCELTVCRGGGTAHPPNDPETTPEMNLFRMNGPGIYRLASRLLEPFLAEALLAAGWQRAEIEHVVPHQASGRGVDLLTRFLGFRDEQVVRNVETRGNCAAASLPIALAEAVQAGRVRRGESVLLIGTGAGLTLGAVALHF